MPRYRTGIDRFTGKPLVGFAHVQQSVGVILRTLLTERWMLAKFGYRGVRHIGRNLSEPVVLAMYRDVVDAVHPFEPEYRIARLQLVELGRTGTLGLGTSGTYYPEGRFGNYDIAEKVDASFPLLAASTVGQAA